MNWTNLCQKIFCMSSRSMLCFRSLKIIPALSQGKQIQFVYFPFISSFLYWHNENNLGVFTYEGLQNKSAASISANASEQSHSHLGLQQQAKLASWMPLLSRNKTQRSGSCGLLQIWTQPFLRPPLVS